MRKLAALAGLILSLAPASALAQAYPQAVVGFDPGPTIAEATPANASHAAGTSVGGLFSVPIARVPGGSGIATNLFWKFTGGGTGSYVVRLWSVQPTNTTCTDNVAYSQSNEQDDRFLIVPPFTITAAAPGNTTGDSASYAQQLGITFDYRNLDSTRTPNIYECLVTTGIDTADENKLIRAYGSGPQN